MTVKAIDQLLRNAATLYADRGVLAYARGGIQQTPKRLTYVEIHRLAMANSKLILNLDGCYQGSIILLHFEDHLDNIIWMWSVLYAGCVPAMSTALPKRADHCKIRLHHLNHLLDNPVCLTRSALRPQFPSETGLEIAHVEDLKMADGHDTPGVAGLLRAKTADIALLLLTSGSTGQPKAVCLTHEQIMASLSGKCVALPVDVESSSLNWIRLDHVGSLVEIHLLSLFAGTDQVHVQPEEFISDPSAFLRLIERHHVTRTFALNFFLSELSGFLESPAAANISFDLRCLRYIVSGGEANVVTTCAVVSRILGRYGAPSNVIVPGFGMTETCAGSIYNTFFPDYDVEKQYELASVGCSVPGLEIRITSSINPNALAGPGEVGNLEVKGSVVFSKYYNDNLATINAFTSDGFFKTGDTAFTDAAGRLNLVGRTKDLVSINGVKYQPHELDAALKDAGIEGVNPGYLTCFSHRGSGAQTEQLLVAYVPSYPNDDLKARYDTMNAISQIVLLVTSSRPIVLPLKAIERTSLGKISRSGMSKALHTGQYQTEQVINTELIMRYERLIYTPPANDLEQVILEELIDVLGLPHTAVGVKSDIFEMGLTSITLIKLQHRLQERLRLSKELPLAAIITHSTVRSLATALQHRSNAYTPIVSLRSHGDKTPLWLIHPAAGESMVFLNLAKLITDRPVYSLRARGFVAGEPYFTSLDECVGIYHSAIKEKQPRGPYVIAGYSYGGMLAFEIGKLLERNGDEVRFLASVNRPPRVHPRLRCVQWSDCLVNLAYFVEVISEDVFRVLLTELEGLSKADAITRLIREAEQTRLVALGLDGSKLQNWANVTLSLQDLARQYQPCGSVGHMDVFYCDPLEMVGATREEWFKRLGEWQSFSRKEIKYYELQGKHHNVFAPEHVRSLHKTIVKAMAARDA